MRFAFPKSWLTRGAALTLALSIPALIVANATFNRKPDKPFSSIVPTPTILQLPSPTPKPAVKGVIYQAPKALPSPTPQPTLSKIPVVLPHNGLTYYCDSTIAQSVKDASKNLKDAINQQIGCLDRQEASMKTCSSSCSKDVGVCDYPEIFGYGTGDECLDKLIKEQTDCIDNCYNGSLAQQIRSTCYSMATTYSDSLNGLLDKHCR